MQVCHFIKAQDGSKVAGYICGIVLFEHAGHAWSYAVFRLVETLLGIGVAIAVSFFPKLIRFEDTGPPAR
jgi:hypothetical protein